MIMSISSAPAAAGHIAIETGSGRAVATVKRWWLAYVTWRAERAAIATLSALSDRQLKDFGLTRSGIVPAVREAMQKNRSKRA